MVRCSTSVTAQESRNTSPAASHQRYAPLMGTLIKMIKIRSGDDGGSETVAAEQIDAETFKLVENPVLNCRINYGTIIKVIQDLNGELVMSKIIRASDFRTRQFMLSASLNETQLRTQIGQPILDAGGMWEVVFGGIAFIHLPKNSTFDLNKLFKSNEYYPSEIVDDTNGGA